LFHLLFFASNPENLGWNLERKVNLPWPCEASETAFWLQKGTYAPLPLAPREIRVPVTTNVQVRSVVHTLSIAPLMSRERESITRQPQRGKTGDYERKLSWSNATTDHVRLLVSFPPLARQQHRPPKTD